MDNYSLTIREDKLRKLLVEAHHEHWRLIAENLSREEAFDMVYKQVKPYIKKLYPKLDLIGNYNSITCFACVFNELLFKVRPENKKVNFCLNNCVINRGKSSSCMEEGALYDLWVRLKSHSNQANKVALKISQLPARKFELRKDRIKEA